MPISYNSPGAMTLAATGSSVLAEQVAHATGRELKLVGINWAYSPVADVNSDPRNPVIGENDILLNQLGLYFCQVFGHLAMVSSLLNLVQQRKHVILDPRQVGIYASSVARGLTMAGIAPSAKHFPGHGDTSVDSHLALPRIMKSRTELNATELPPFTALIAQGVASIMTGHMALPAVTGTDTPCS